MHFGDFARIGFARHRAVTYLVVPDVVPAYAFSHELNSSIVSDPFRPVEQIEQHGFVCHCAILLRYAAAVPHCSRVDRLAC